MTSSPSFVRSRAARTLAAIALTLIILAPDTASAQTTPAKDAPQASGCAAFKWPLDAERKAFEDAGLETVASGATRGALKEQAFALTLQPDTDIAYALPPAKKKKAPEAKHSGGIVTFAAPEKAGTFQVTLSGEGWIDLVQQGAALDAGDHSGVKDCPGLRKSVRFKVGEAPVVLQISGAPADTIKVAIRPVD